MVRIVGLNVFKTNQEAVDVDVLPRYRDYKDTTVKKIKQEKDTEISLQRILHSAGHAAIFFFSSSSSSSFINSLLDFTETSQKNRRNFGCERAFHLRHFRRKKRMTNIQVLTSTHSVMALFWGSTFFGFKALDLWQAVVIITGGE